MIKTKFWLSLLAISVVLVAGSLAVSPIAIAGDDEDDEDEDDDAGVVSSRGLVYEVSATISVPTGFTPTIMATASCDIGDVLLTQSLVLRSTPKTVFPFLGVLPTTQTPLGPSDNIIPVDGINIRGGNDGSLPAFTATASAFCIKKSN